MISHRAQSAKALNLCLFLLSFVFLIGGCAVPRIVVLDDPLTSEEHINLGLAYEKKGMIQEALNEYRKAAKTVPVADYYIGNLYFQADELDLAEEYYKKALRRDQGNADALNNLAWLYYVKNENLDVAENLVLRALELNPLKSAQYRDTLEKIQSLRTEIR